MHTLRAGQTALLLCAGLIALTGCSDVPGDGTGSGRDAAAVNWSAVTFTAAPSASGDALRRTADRIRQRATALGMEEARVALRDGSIVVTGRYSSDRLKGLGASGRLWFRPVLAREDGAPGTAAPQPGAPQGRSAGGALRADGSASPQPVPSAGPAGITPELEARYRALDCSRGRGATADGRDAHPGVPVVACAADPAAGEPASKFLLGPAVLTGTDIASAEAKYDASGGAGWLVLLDFTSSGTAKFSRATGQLARNQAPQNEFAVVVDGGVVSAPYVTQALTGGNAQISGGFTRNEAQELAAQLNSGALPVPLTFAGATRVAGP